MLELYIMGAKRVIAHLNNNHRKIYKIGPQGPLNPHGPFLYLKAVGF